MIQAKLYRVGLGERRRENPCPVCGGNRSLCREYNCPILAKARALLSLEKVLDKTEVFGASPPSVFVGSYGYPRVLAGPLLPPIARSELDTSIMDLPELWVDKSLEEIMRYRFSMVRGKAPLEVSSARNPGRLLSTIQEMVMASRPVDMEMRLRKKPSLQVFLSPRAPPMGPSGAIERAVLAENPPIPRMVDEAVSDTDLRASHAVLGLYASGLPQTQITRLFSIGLLGVKRQRRLVPTEWGITAVDDALGRALQRRVLANPWLNEYMLFGHRALGNNVQILLLPSSYMFEALEAWLTQPDPTPGSDMEYEWGRTSYAENLEGAYYAAKLPVLEYLDRTRRQAAALAFLEVYPEWVPLGVWRFREIAREALRRSPFRAGALAEALEELRGRLRIPLERWLGESRLLEIHASQTRLTRFASG